MEIIELQEKEYKDFLKNFKDISFFQSVEWAKFKSKSEWNMVIVGLKDGKNIKAAATLLYRKIPIINKKMYYSPRGYVLDFNDFDLIKEFTIELKKYLKKNNGIFLKINPYVEYIKRDKDGKEISKPNDELVNLLKSLGYIHNGFYINQDEKKDLEPRWLSVLNIENKDIDTILKETRQTTRWMINKSKKNSINIKIAEFEDIKTFKEVMNDTALRREFEDRAISYYENMYKMIDKDILRIVIADINLNELKNTMKGEISHLEDRIKLIKDIEKKKNQVLEFESQIDALNKRLNGIEKDIEKYGDNPVVAVGLYLTYQDQTVYLFGGSYKEFMGYGAQYLMQYEMIKYSIERGIKKYNFYGIDGNFNENSKNYGLFDFKRGFNSDVVELIGEFDLIVSNFYYKLYNFMMKTYQKLRHLKGILRK